MTNLTQEQQQVFRSILRKHLASMGEVERTKYDLERVEWDEADQVFRVYFTNGHWWHYTLDGKWY